MLVPSLGRILLGLREDVVRAQGDWCQLAAFPPSLTPTALSPNNILPKLGTNCPEG